MKHRLHQKLEWAIEDALSKPPSATGRRLAPERVLCEETGISRVTLRRAIESLIARDLLVRRHGSGTYVRKVPPPPEIPDAARGAFTLEAKTLFAAEPESPTRLRLPADRRSLHIVGWLNENSEYVQRILTGMHRRAEQEGHHFVNIAVDPRIKRDITRLRRHIARNHIDGYVIDSDLASVFENAFSEPRPPVVYIGHGEFDPDHEPVIQVDPHNAIQRALYKLRDCGYTRIGLIALDETPANKIQMESYDRCMAELGLKYRRVASLPRRPRSRIEDLRAMLLTEPRPQAVYIGDDILLRGLVKLMETLDCRPGRDIAAITLGSYGVPLPKGYDWSVMEFNPVQAGALALECLAREITRAGEPICSIVHRPAWHPGSTHLLL
jgi:DNA-binding LacI/PurR family transcriptional regulator/DNA-binding transcriptional regulator YhcF (GntR family)